MENQLDPFACPALGGLFSVSELYGRTAGGSKSFERSLAVGGLWPMKFRQHRRRCRSLTVSFCLSPFPSYLQCLLIDCPG